MAEALRGCLSLTLSGYAYASHDIGGFEVSFLWIDRILAKIHE
jgi:alpha-glucosidase (family GH31 glycosyl hydrolase)